MSKTSFLTNKNISQMMTKIVKESDHVDAAIAYFGTNGAKYFPLKKNDYLVVDMSIGKVKSGSTNPFEIEKLLNKGVKVFSRRNLHAKILITNKNLLVGSANISKNAREIQDEAAVCCNDKLAIQRAKYFFDQICIEPVILGSEYLAQCKKLYKPPKSNVAKVNGETKSNPRPPHAKLQIVSLIDYAIFPESEKENYENSKGKAKKIIRKSDSVLHTFRWANKPRMVDNLEQGDWIIQCIEHSDKSISVHPPAQLILIDHYFRDKKTGKERYVFHLESPKNGQKIDWKIFRKKLNAILSAKKKSPPTMAVRNIMQADDLLRLWTPKGRIARKKIK